MSKKREDPLTSGDFYEFKAYVESELSSLKKEQEWVRKSLETFQKNIEKLEQSIDKYKWWIVGSFFSATALFTLLSYILKLVS